MSEAIDVIDRDRSVWDRWAGMVTTWARAACRPHPTQLFFLAEHEQRAKAICRSCPIQRECLRYAVLADEVAGVWGGMTRTERLAMVDRIRRRGAA